MPVKVNVTRTESGSLTEAMRLAVQRAPVNYGMSEIKAGSKGWTFVFVAAR